MLNDEYVTVVAGGRIYTGWEKVQVTASLKEAARTFTLETTEHPGEWNFKPGTPIDILANGDLMVRGYVNSYIANVDKSTHVVRIQGRGKGQDYVDSAAEHPGGNWEDKKPDEIARDLDKFGVGIRSEVPLDKVPYFQLAPGERAFDAAERLLRHHGVTMMGEPDGTIKITNATKAKHIAGALIEGRNIERAQVTLTDGSRHSSYTVKGQGRLGKGRAGMRVRETYRDRGVKRNRPRTLIAEGDTDPKRAKKRARNERDKAAGESIRAQVVTQGFHDVDTLGIHGIGAAGKLFAPNTLIYVHSPIFMHLAMTMLIERITFDQDKNGSLTTLSLVDPRAHQGKGGKDGTGSRSAGTADAETDDAWTEGYDGEESGASAP